MRRNDYDAASKTLREQYAMSAEFSPEQKNLTRWYQEVSSRPSAKA